MAKRVGTQNNQPFIKIFDKLAYRFTSWEVWKDFIFLSATAISNAVDKSHYDEREKLYLSVIQKYNKEEQELFPQLLAETVCALEKNPEQDFLGKLFMQLGLGSEKNGQFFTPYHVCEFMAKVTIGDILPQVQERGYITINDCACGAGATLIAGIHEAGLRLEKANLNWQNHVLVAAQDIDYTTALMCYIQLSLLGAAAYIKIGNTLTEPMCPNDTLENYWFTPMYFSETWTIRRILKNKNIL